MTEHHQQFLRRMWTSMRHSAGAEHANGASHLLRLCASLLSQRGEISSARIAAEAIGAYNQLNDHTRSAFFDALASDYSADAVDLRRAIDAYQVDPSPAHVFALHKAAEPRRQELFRRLNTAPGGTQMLVKMRSDLVRTLGDHPERTGIDVDLVHLFRSWFNHGFLVLQRIDWKTSAVVLERLIQYEAVHQIQGWHDLRRRLGTDRRCYAFFHPALPDEPLIFIEVALTVRLSGNVQVLLDPRSAVIDPAGARCAMFYSITNCQAGLRGVSFGNFLIKQVAADLTREFPRIRKFATLSPIPGFRAWLAGAQVVSADFGTSRIETADQLARIPEALTHQYQRLCAYYLVHEKRGHQPLDSVARFHLANGARLARINWMGDCSAAGIATSLGMTANYVYRLAEVEANHDAYATNFDVVTSVGVERLAREGRGNKTSRIARFA
jgi:malonyl-CoA decarboxylase